MSKATEDGALRIIRAALGGIDQPERVRVLARLREVMCLNCGQERRGHVPCEFLVPLGTRGAAVLQKADAALAELSAAGHLPAPDYMSGAKFVEAAQAAIEPRSDDEIAEMIEEIEGR